MKMVYSILLLLVTSIYILPVKETITGNTSIAMFDNGEAKDENKKTEKQKDLFSMKVAVRYSSKFTNSPTSTLFSFIPVLLHTVETPPPDII